MQTAESDGAGLTQPTDTRHAVALKIWQVLAYPLIPCYMHWRKSGVRSVQTVPASHTHSQWPGEACDVSYSCGRDDGINFSLPGKKSCSPEFGGFAHAQFQHAICNVSCSQNI